MEKLLDQVREKKTEILGVSLLIVLAAVLRFHFLSATDLSEFDPWRHLQLIRNIRNGAGFTLFDSQHYIWYNRIWYHFAAALAPAEKVQWISATLSILSVPLFYLFLLKTEKSATTAFAGGLLLAAFGPVVCFTGTYGSESFAFFLLLASFVLATRDTGMAPVLLSGLFFGIALVSRMNFAFNLFLILPLLKTRRNIALFSSTFIAVLAASWWDNYLAIRSAPYVFTWDGLATASSDYNFLSILVPQLHPAVAAATRSLHLQIAPYPLEIYWQGHFVWGNVIFIGVGLACIALSRRWSLAAAGLAPVIYFIFFDKSLTSNFFRIYLGVFPAFFVAIALVAEKIRRMTAAVSRLAIFVWLSLLLAVIFSGVRYLRPQRMIRLETATPPPDLLTQQNFMVNSGFYHPESLAFRYPDKKFIGMPLDPDQFDDFARHFPRFTTILWHKRFTVQDDLLKHLLLSKKYEIVTTKRNEAGMTYLLLEKVPHR